MISPLIRYRRLAMDFQRLRAERRMTMQDLVDATGIHRQRVSALENTHERPNLMFVAKLYKALDASEDRLRGALKLAAEANFDGWWEAYPALGERQIVYAELEYGAATIREYCNICVPGLVQISDYIRVRSQYDALADNQFTEQELKDQVEARRARQMMIRDLAGPGYEAIVVESALRLSTAPAEVMSAQLRYLARLPETARSMAVRILPMDAVVGHYVLPKCSFTLFTYPDPDDPPAAIVDTDMKDFLFTAPDMVERYARLYGQIDRAALTVQDSVAFLSRLADEFETGGSATLRER